MGEFIDFLISQFSPHFWYGGLLGVGGFVVGWKE